MVRRYHGHWNRVSPSLQHTIQGTLVVLVISRLLRPQCSDIHHLLHNLHTEIHSLSRKYVVSSGAAIPFFSNCANHPSIFPVWRVMVADRTNSLFLGCFPIGFATLIEAWIFLCVPYWGPWAVTFAWVCWMIDSIVSVAVTVSLAIILISTPQQHQLVHITAVQLLPIAATIVASGTGAEGQCSFQCNRGKKAIAKSYLSSVAKVLPNPQDALGTLVASYVMWGLSVPFAMTVLVMYYQRLALHKLPPREIVVSSFLPIGPLGMGGYTIMYLGSVCRNVFPQTEFFQDIAIAGDIFYINGIFIALMMWSFALLWLCFAVATCHKLRPFPFNMGWVSLLSTTRMSSSQGEYHLHHSLSRDARQVPIPIFLTCILTFRPRV